MSFKKCFTIVTFIICFTISVNTLIFGQYTTDKPLYLYHSRSIKKRVEDLLSRMTLEEKIGQLNMNYSKRMAEELSDQIEASRRFVQGIQFENVGPGGGLFAPAYILINGPRQQAEIFNKLQKIAIEKTRLKIPLIMIEEGTLGVKAPGSTIFPEGLAIGSSWNLDLVRKIYSAVAKEAKAIGVHALCTLVIEPNRDPRLGRNEEGYSEDPYMCSQIAETIVQATQGDDISADDKVIAVLCHFPGQSQPVSGMERGIMEIPERVLRNVFLPPWTAGIKKAGALGVMAAYPSVNDEPAHASKRLLTKILREELGFEGVVLSEGTPFDALIYEGVAANQKEAGELAIKAGVDVSINVTPAYKNLLIENVKEGKVSIETINRSVRRILQLKFQLGLFKNPYVDIDCAENIVHSKEHQQLTLQAAREGIVLLKNTDNLLPLKKDIKSIAVIGPNANNGRNQLGDYVANHIIQDIVTFLDGIKNKVSKKTNVTYIQGCDIIKNEINEIAEAKTAAESADVAVVVVGENDKTNGERNDVASLDLTGLQEDLVKAVFETGTPTVVVLINGRPLSIRWIAENVPAIVEEWNCGEQGGSAIADVLFGDYNPSGRLPITFPRHSGQLPVYYNYKPSKAIWIKKSYVDMPATPLYEFGYGLSYTKFEYSNLQISPKKIGSSGNVNISLDVKNIGDRKGDEVVQLYINDVMSSMSTPIRELKGFKKITLAPGEKKSVTFTLTPEHLSMLDRNLERVVEPGTFDVMIGSSCEDIRLKGRFECN